MAIPVPPDWAASEDITEVKLDSISTVLTWLLSPPHCYAYKSVDGALSNAVFSAINFNAELYDWSISAMHDPTANDSRISAPEPGIYTLKGHATFGADAVGARGLMFRKNANASATGGTEILRTFNLPSSGNTGYVFASVDYQLNAGDYVEMFCYQSSGASLTVTGGPGSLFMSMRWATKV